MSCEFERIMEDCYRIGYIGIGGECGGFLSDLRGWEKILIVRRELIYDEESCFCCWCFCVFVEL